MKRFIFFCTVIILALPLVIFTVGCQTRDTLSPTTAEPSLSPPIIFSPVPPPSSSISGTILTPTPITAQDAYMLVQKNIGNPDFVILDVRTADEFNTGHIAGAINIDYDSTQFNVDVSKLDKNKQYLVYCETGVRGAAATQIMINLGFKQVQNMAGGITAWIQDGYPISGSTTTESTVSKYKLTLPGLTITN